MTEKQWQSFAVFRKSFRKKVTEWNSHAPRLIPLAAAAAEKDTPPYPLKTAVVYNRALDDVTPSDDIRYFIIGDNPGKDEQRAQNNRYLVGASGKLGERFFRLTPELCADFRKNTVILNKTPVHTAKTKHLAALSRHDTEIAQLITDSQIWMAQQTALLHQAFVAHAAPNDHIPELWLVGYAELRHTGICVPYRDALRSAYAEKSAAWEHVFVYQHFSMNRFTIDLNEWRRHHPDADSITALAEIGVFHRKDIFGA
ncbi:MAG: hypothetical protein IJ191_04730 [Treponema sp.]|nr:hypothetical protein [Treponema sp.]